MTEPQRRIGLRAVRWVVAGTLALAVAAVAAAYALRARRGWRGSYYANRDLRGEPIVRRDPAVAFRWYDDPPLPGFRADDFSVRWESCLVVNEPGPLEAYAAADDGIRLRVDGELVIDEFKQQPFTARRAPLKLKPGIHHVVVEYYDAHSHAHAQVRFQRPGLPARPLDLSHYLLPGPDPDAPCP